MKASRFTDAQKAFIIRQGDAAGRSQTKALRPAQKRTLVDDMRLQWDVSIRRACRVLYFDPKSYRYKSRRPISRDIGQAGLEQRIKEICQTRVRVACPGLDPGAIDASMCFYVGRAGK